MANITRCICPLSGTYVVMLTKLNSNSQPTTPPQRPLFVIISCVCGLLQSCSAFIILLPIWYNRKCAITFLKMQFCVSTTSMMIIFILGFLKMLPMNWQAVVNSSLASLLLLGVTTAIAIALVINSELVPKKMQHISNRMSTTTTTAAPSVRSMTKKAQEQHNINKRHNAASGNDNGNNTTPLSTNNAATTVIDAASLSITTNITQISSSGGGGGGSSKGNSNGSTDDSIANDSNASNNRHLDGVPAARSVALLQELYFPVSVRAVIGISWLLPLLYAIAVPLICSIIGKWPRNWWLEVLSNTTADGTTTATTTTTTTTTDTAGSMRYGGLSALESGSDYLTTHMTHSPPPPGSSLSLKIEAHNSITENTTTTRITTAVTNTNSSLANGISLATTSTTAAAWNSSTNTNASATASQTLPSSSAYTASSLISNSTSTATSTTFSVVGWHNNFQPTSISASANASFSAAAYRSEYGADYATLNADEVGSGSGVPAFSFIIFICIDLLFVLLFCALFFILIKKLLWLWHKQRDIHSSAHPLDKYNVAMRRRIGLIYRTGCLLLMKLSTDALFIAYVNLTQNSWLSYPFGISCILLGFSILYCFVIKAESNLRTPSNSSSYSGTLKKKLSSSKTSLDENYCTGSINSPLSFYSSQEKEKENDSGAPITALLAPPPPQQLEISSGVQLPLTIMPTAQQRCQLLPPKTAATIGGGGGVKTFLNAASLSRKLPTHATCLQETSTSSAMTSPATRCCNILGGGSSGGNSGATVTSTGLIGGGGGVVLTTGGMGYYDAYGAGMTLGSMTGSLNRRQMHGPTATSTEFVGLQTLDILQGVAPPDAIIGICSSNLPAGMSYHQLQHHSLPRHYTSTMQQQQHQHQQLPATATQLVAHNTCMNQKMMPTTIVSISSGLPQQQQQQTTINYVHSSGEIATPTQPLPLQPTTTLTSCISTTTATTQTPKTQKRVTIMEPTTHTFDPLLPTMVAVSGVAGTVAGPHHRIVTTTPIPIITISNNTSNNVVINDGSSVGSSVLGDTMQSENGTVSATPADTPTPEDEMSMTGMLDRITHDLDYLLNRTNELPPPETPSDGEGGVALASVAAAAATVSAVSSQEANTQL